MARVLPSQAASIIRRAYPFVEAADDPPPLGIGDAGNLSSILAIVDAIPEELIALEGDELFALIGGHAAIAHHVQRWEVQGKLGGFVTGSTLKMMWLALKRCPDQVVPETVSALSFLADHQLRESLRVDIAEVERALVDGEWKSATVMSGSIIESLLLWALDQQRTLAEQTAVGVSKHPIKDALEAWSLYHYIEVAHALNVIKDDTAAQLRLAKDFRNLIHPGRAKRLAQKCDRATARAAAAGIDFVVRDLTP